MNRVPHLRVVIGFCAAAVVGYAGFSIWVVYYLRDATMVGDIVGTWKSFAVAAFAFWLGSSSAGKTVSSDPQPVVIEQPPTKPVPTTDETLELKEPAP